MSIHHPEFQSRQEITKNSNACTQPEASYCCYDCLSTQNLQRQTIGNTCTTTKHKLRYVMNHHAWMVLNLITNKVQRNQNLPHKVLKWYISLVQTFSKIMRSACLHYFTQVRTSELQLLRPCEANFGVQSISTSTPSKHSDFCPCVMAVLCVPLCLSVWQSSVSHSSIL